MMAQLPYGANILINSDPAKSSVGEFYTKSHPDYITSINYPSTITFNYSEQNCELVGISTNLTIIDWDKTNKTFTLSNEGEVFNNGIIPNIALLCNDVELPIVFSSQGGTFTNSWHTQENYGNNMMRIYDRNGGTVIIPKKYRVSWSTEETINIFTNSQIKSNNTYICDIFYDYLKNNVTKNDGKNRLINVGTNIPNTQIIIPKLNGTSSKIKIKKGNSIQELTLKGKIYKRLYMALSINLGEGDKCVPETYYYLAPGKHELYNSIGIPESMTVPTSGYRTIESFGGLPALYSMDYKKWHSDFLYKTINNEEEEVYVSPSTSKILSTLSVSNVCDSGCDDCDGGCDESPQRHLVIDANTSDGYYWDTDTQQYIRFVSFQVPIGTEIWSWEETDATYFYDYEYYDPVEQRTTDKVRTLKTQAHIVE